MRTENRPDGGQRQSFIKQARRDQVVTAAIEVLAETGYGSTSLAAIAQHAGISKSVISYHFSGKDELMETVVDAIYTDVAAAVGPQLDDADSPADRVRAYVLSVAQYARKHRSRLSALGKVTANLRTADGRLQYGMHTSEALSRSSRTSTPTASAAASSATLTPG
jgi:TetR/AcrR family transcriptional regulator, fatty acid metabolism regulator protein